jgi:Ras-related protein Rab-28
MASPAPAAGDVVCKLILVGNGSAGKTSICARFKEDGFKRVYKQTVGLDFYEKRVSLRGRQLTLQVWDIGGQSIGSAMLPTYIAGAAVVFLVYDVTDNQSFQDAQDWHGVVARAVAAGAAAGGGGGAGAGAAAAPAARAPAMYLVGNKVDLAHLRAVPAAAHDALVASARLEGGFFVSARSGEGVVTAFYTAAARVLGFVLTEHELALTQRVLGVVVSEGTDEARTAWADAIEREDAAAQAKRDAGAGCCAVQ